MYSWVGTLNGTQPSAPLYNDDAESFAITRGLFRRIVSSFDRGLPDVDAFAAEGNNQIPKFWSLTNDALGHDWGTPRLIWANPPFSLIPRVMQKVMRGNVRTILIAPRWESIPWNMLTHRAARWFLLPIEKLFCKVHREPAWPPPRWRCGAFLFAPVGCAIMLTVRRHVHDVTSDGDVEANPGPGPLGFW